jgi:hypothetical protein
MVVRKYIYLKVAKIIRGLDKTVSIQRHIHLFKNLKKISVGMVDEKKL